MSHSDSSIDDLLRQVDDYRQRRHLRDNRPDRVSRFIEDVAGLFEPTHGVGRVGYECQPSADGWSVAMYLGATEIVGGRHDGQSQRAGFSVDLNATLQLYTSVDDVQFGVEPDSGDKDGWCRVVITGKVDQHRLLLSINAVPPAELTPAFRRFPDGTLRLTDPPRS